MAVSVAGGLIKIEFNNSTIPVFVEKKNKDWVYYGEQNNYPSFVIDLYNRHPVHAAILKAKCKFISGKGLFVKPSEYNAVIDAVRAESFLQRANRYEDWSSVFKKTVESLEIFNGFYWQIIWDLGGLKCEVYPMQFAKCRVSKDGKKILYSEQWLNEDGSPKSNPEVQEFDVFNPAVRKGTQVYFYKVTDQYSDGIGDTYPLPEYKGAIINISTDVAISDFQNNLATHGMTAQGMLTLFKGEPDEPERKKLEKMFNRKFTGPGGSSVMLNFTDGGDVGAEWTTFQTSDLDKQFELISKNNRENIITGHQIPNKGLVGISTEGALSDRTAIDLGFEQLQNTYVEPRQEMLLNEVKMIGELCGYNLDGVDVKQLKPIGIDYLNPNIQKYLTTEEIREHLGLENKTPVQDNAATPINENLRGLTGKDWIHINRIIRNVKNGKISKEAGAMMIKSGYGVSDSDIGVLFGESGQQVAQFNVDRTADDILCIYEKFAIDDDGEDVEEYEFESKVLESQILEILKGEPTATANKIATMLDEPFEMVEESLQSLVQKQLIDTNYQPTQKGLETKTRVPELEVYTVYKYVTRPDVPEVQSTSRPFCKRLLELTRNGKVWTKEGIDNITNEMGEDAWTYRGGFYTNPQTQETTAYCRHIWKSVRRTRKK